MLVYNPVALNTERLQSIAASRASVVLKANVMLLEDEFERLATAVEAKTAVGAVLSYVK